MTRTEHRPPPVAMLIARLPEAGRVKTRLGGPDGFDDHTCAAIAAAMLRCAAVRLASAFDHLVIAVTPDAAAPDMQADILNGANLANVSFISQGQGSLGERLVRAWTTIGHDRPVACFGMDSPDLPAAALAQVQEVVNADEAAIGPTEDGGYWTLAAPRLVPQLFESIDWGSDRVYHQTHRQANAASVVLRDLPRWTDIDTPSDLAALRTRLHGPDAMADPALIRLASTLDELVGNH